MKQPLSSLAGLFALTALLPLACSSDDNEPTQTGNPATPNGSAGTTATAGTAGTTNLPSGGAANAGSGAGGAAGGDTSTAGAAGDGAGPGAPVDWIEGEIVGVPGVQGAFAFFDGVSTYTLTAPNPGEVCLNGQASLAGMSYENWGAGLGLQFSTTDAAGVVESAFDAAAAGAAGFSFTITGAPVTGVRTGITQVNEPGTIFQENAFLNGPDSTGDVRADGTVEIYFADLEQPSWSPLAASAGADGGAGLTFNASSVHAVQWQVVTNQAVAVDYDFCITNFAWIDADGNPVTGSTPETDAGAPEPDAG